MQAYSFLAVFFSTFSIYSIFLPSIPRSRPLDLMSQDGWDREERNCEVEGQL